MWDAVKSTTGVICPCCGDLLQMAWANLRIAWQICLLLTAIIVCAVVVVFCVGKSGFVWDKFAL